MIMCKARTEKSVFMRACGGVLSVHIRETNLFDVESRTRRHRRRNMPANIRGFLKGIKPSPPVEANDRLKPSNMDRPHSNLAGNSSHPLPALRRTTLRHLLAASKSYNQLHNNESLTQHLSVCEFQSHERSQTQQNKMERRKKNSHSWDPDAVFPSKTNP